MTDELKDIDPSYHIHPRAEDVVVLENGRNRYVLVCDDGMEDEVTKMVARMNKRLAKFDQMVEILGEEEFFVPHWFKRDWAGNPIQIRQVRLTIESPAVSGKSAKLVGMFERAEEGDEVYRYNFGGSRIDLTPWLPRWNDCDHCKKKRDRNSSFLCETAEGELVLIGRQCSMDYLGLHPSDILAREAIRRVFTSDSDEDGEERSFGSFKPRIYTEFLARTAYQVAVRYGGYSREIRGKIIADIEALFGAKDYGKSTFNADTRRWYKEHPIKEPLDLHALADYVFKMRGDFATNLQIAMSAVAVHPKRQMIIIAGVGLFVGKAAQLKKERESRPVQKMMPGEPEQKVEIFGTIVRTSPYQSNFGVKTVIVILTDAGETCVHFSAKAENPTAGKRYHIKATIAKQDDAKQQTVLTRAVYTDPVQGELFAPA